MAQVREAFDGVSDADPQAAEELHQARHALKHALGRKRGAAPDEVRRIAAILDRATAEILGRRPNHGHEHGQGPGQDEQPRKPGGGGDPASWPGDGEPGDGR